MTGEKRLKKDWFKLGFREQWNVFVKLRINEASHKCREVALKIYTRPQGGNSTTSTDNERLQAGAEDSRMRLVDSEDTIVKWCAVTVAPHSGWREDFLTSNGQ